MAKQRRPGPITAPVFHHTTLATRRLDEMIAFYESVAGLRPVYADETAAWLTNDEANHRIALLALPGLKDPQDKGATIGLHHTAFEYATFDQWVDNYERLRDDGITPFLSLDHGMTMSLYYQDPEGNGVEIQVDVFGDWSASTEFMWASPAFEADPIGRHFEPEQVAAARADGLAFAEIHRRAQAGEYAPAQAPGVHLPSVALR